jgi:hypothetical protein
MHLANKIDPEDVMHDRVSRLSAQDRTKLEADGVTDLRARLAYEKEEFMDRFDEDM